MSVIAEYETQLTHLRATLDAVPAMTVHHDDVFSTATDEVKWLFWASGGDQDAFQTALDDDPTVETARVLSETPTQSLYRTTLVGSPSEFTLTAFTDLDVQVLGVTHRHDGTVVRVRCPSQDAYRTLGTTIREASGRFRTRALFPEESATVDEYPVTPAQREALLVALERGYFDVPKRVGLDEVGAELGISDNAASSRLRRGTAALIRNTLGRKTE